LAEKPKSRKTGYDEHEDGTKANFLMQERRL